MTTDTAVRVTRIVVQEKSKSSRVQTLQIQLTWRAAPLAQIPYLDFPELKLDDHESTEMPFRYVKGADGQPIMPEAGIMRKGKTLNRTDNVQGMLELIKEDADKGFEDLELLGETEGMEDMRINSS